MTKTRTQILAEMSQKKNEKHGYVIAKTNYEKSLEYANKLVGNLNSYNTSSNSSKEYLKKYYTINGKTADNGKLDDINNTISLYLNQLNNNIIPEIKKNVNILNSKISSIEREVLLLEKQYKQLARKSYAKQSFNRREIRTLCRAQRK